MQNGLFVDDKTRERLLLSISRLRESFTIRSAVVFGSSVKACWNYRSDIDLLIVSDSMGKDWFERNLAAQRVVSGGVQVFVLTSSEILSAINDRRYVVWEALHDGLVIFDDGVFTSVRSQFMSMIQRGLIKKRSMGWIVADVLG